MEPHPCLPSQPQAAAALVPYLPVLPAVQLDFHFANTLSPWTGSLHHIACTTPMLPRTAETPYLPTSRGFVVNATFVLAQLCPVAPPQGWRRAGGATARPRPTPAH